MTLACPEQKLLRRAGILGCGFPEVMHLGRFNMHI